MEGDPMRDQAMPMGKLENVGGEFGLAAEFAG